MWRGAVAATHDFLSDQDRVDLESQVSTDFLPQVEIHVAERAGHLVGFSGVSGTKLEMLFVDANSHGGGVGSALLSHAVRECRVDAVDVNEQNRSAVEFYQRRGFRVVGRSERDDQGRPYPLLHLALDR
ncbi:MAG: acetyltransferase [Propionibacteriales bacterium]|nr:acetyltransferase [Propionibacteriales bacterium]